MKTAIYIEEGITQLVITPETEFERNAVSMLTKQNVSVKILSGSFYETRGGWIRNAVGGSMDQDDNSLILRVGSTPETPSL